MKLIKIFIILSSLSLNAIAKPPQASELLRKSDRARGGLNDGITWEIEIATTQGQDTKNSVYEVKVKGSNILAVCSSPARQKGETYLFNNRNLWVYRSNLRKPISVSTRQRLSGQTSNGDIAATNYAKDYNAEIVKSEAIAGESSYKLLLKAKTTDLTYDQIHYWISEKSGLALQADFLTSEGKSFKRATFKYNNIIQAGSKSEPFISEMTISETAFPENKSVLTYKNLNSKKLDDSVFNVNNLSR